MFTLNSDLKAVYFWVMDQDVELSSEQVEAVREGLLDTGDYIFAMSSQMAHEGLHIALSNIEKLRKAIHEIKLVDQRPFEDTCGVFYELCRAL